MARVPFFGTGSYSASRFRDRKNRFRAGNQGFRGKVTTLAGCMSVTFNRYYDRYDRYDRYYYDRPIWEAKWDACHVC